MQCQRAGDVDVGVDCGEVAVLLGLELETIIIVIVAIIVICIFGAVEHDH